ncbi:hypothetical protein SAMN02745172_01337 [Pseudoxanthobacter soli DSM 19599]|uniref:Flagellar assembly protein FliH n=1 Tax=Pseudoxanthobacter soli DSM 19599 TaxID=1123029 RepID=A0A1M7ZEJ8_9HYPH|nr:hypothetical protein [Pseudoxanthobacter soli]SHO63303.1 hypothetical protein SAMN02745172_01337 [Pseudoxanthobacter soli DSM 19599]
MRQDLARFLPNFEEPSAKGEESRAPVTEARVAQAVADAVARATAEALERGRREGAEAERAANKAARAAELAALDKRLADERRRWSEEEAERLADRFALAVASLEESLLSSVARTLVPFLDEGIRRRAHEGLCDLLAGMLETGEHKSLAISGPKDLLAPLQERFARHAAAITFTEADTPDVRVIVDSTVIETQTRIWSELLANAIE